MKALLFYYNTEKRLRQSSLLSCSMSRSKVYFGTSLLRLLCKFFKRFEIFKKSLSTLQGVSPLTVIYNSQNTQICMITQVNYFTFHYHRKINFHLKVSEDNLNYILYPIMQNFQIGQFQLLGYQSSAKLKK